MSWLHFNFHELPSKKVRLSSTPKRRTSNLPRWRLETSAERISLNSPFVRPGKRSASSSETAICKKASPNSSARSKTTPLRQTLHSCSMFPTCSNGICPSCATSAALRLLATFSAFSTSLWQHANCVTSLAISFAAVSNGGVEPSSGGGSTEEWKKPKAAWMEVERASSLGAVSIAERASVPSSASIGSAWSLTEHACLRSCGSVALVMKGAHSESTGTPSCFARRWRPALHSSFCLASDRPRNEVP